MFITLRFLLDLTELWPIRTRFHNRLFRPFKTVMAERKRLGLEGRDG